MFTRVAFSRFADAVAIALVLIAGLNTSSARAQSPSQPPIAEQHEHSNCDG